MEDGVTFETLNDVEDQSHPTQANDVQSLRSELITLAEKHEIKHSVAYIRIASHSALETIRRDQRVSNRDTHGKIIRIYGRD